MPLDEQTLDIGGMTCASCVGRVERVLAKVPGVADVQVNLMTARATIHSAHKIPPAELIAAITRAGYTASPAVAGGDMSHAEPFWRVALALALALPIVLPMLLAPFGVMVMLPGWAQAALATPVLVWLGAGITISGWKSLRMLAPSMDALVAMGTWAAYLLSVGLLLQGARDLYFDSAALVIALVLLGRTLESRARHQAGAALRALANLRPERATRRRDGHEQDVAVSALRAGDLVVVKPGQSVPVDGEVVEGHSDLDQSVLTGESLPVAIGSGGKVMAGAINLSGVLVIRTQTVGAETALGTLIRLVEAAQAAKPAVQKLADRISLYFVPAVLLIALGTLGFWLWHGATPAHAIVIAVSVLVIACPCALGLAAPAAVMAGLGAAARQGILIRDVAAFGQAGGIRTIVFDKTGTLTEGKPRLIAHHAVDDADILPLAAALQVGSLHPLAKALISAVTVALPACTDMRDFPGRGVGGTVAGRSLRLGSARMLAEAGLDEGRLAPSATDLRAQGASVSFLFETAPQTRLLGVFGFADTAKPSAAAAIKALTSQGMRCILLSGDTAASVALMAKSLGLTEAVGGMLPAEKAAYVAKLRQVGKVAMVGDGINDAPALAEANLGIAMAGRADVAMHAAAIVLLRPDPALVGPAIDIARRTERTIWRGLGWAFVFNCIAIPLAATGQLNPMIAGGAMAGSSLAVVLNALTLQFWRPRFR